MSAFDNIIENNLNIYQSPLFVICPFRKANPQLPQAEILF
jgi:hypothetical protein